MSLRAVRAAWRALAPEPVREFAAPAVNQAVRAYVHAAMRPSTSASPPGAPIRVVGFFDRPSGIGASARLCVRALQALGATVETIGPSGPGGRWDPAPTSPAAAWIFHLNAPELIRALGGLGPERIIGPRYGVWAWELPEAPGSWRSDARLMDEIWAPSRYTADALAGARAPIRIVPHPLAFEDYADAAPGPRTAKFQAVTLFDFNSSMARKNPLGALAAFRRAFGEDPGCELVIKTHNGAAHPSALAELQRQAGGNVRVIDEAWPYAEIKSLIAGADALISLHRAEGFGLTLAEAMAMGVAVVATAASGNLDFMDAGTAILVPARPVPVADPQGIYRGQTWAEPDIDAAAEGLRRLRGDPAFGRMLGEAGRRRVAETLSPRAWLAALPAGVQRAIG
jgi:glycosyltransferase involved in cell wall biosynthesis